MAVPKTMRDENHRDRMNTGLDIPKEDKEQSSMPDFKLLAEEVLSKTIEYEKIKNNLINTGKKFEFEFNFRVVRSSILAHKFKFGDVRDATSINLLFNFVFRCSSGALPHQ